MFNPFIPTLTRQLAIAAFTIVGVITGVLLFVWLFFGCGCTVTTDADETEIEKLKVKAEKYCEQITDRTIEHRCDRLTFASLANVGCKSQKIDLGRHLYEGAAYHRDIENCIEPGDSKSECSPDGLIAGLNSSARGVGWGQDQIIGIQSYLDEHDWICGEGPKELTDVKHLKGQMQRVIDKGSNRGSAVFLGEGSGDDGSIVTAGVVPVHNVYLGAIMADTERVLRGRWTDAEKLAIQAASMSRKGSAPLAAMAGDEQKAVDLLNEQCGDEPTGQSYDSWGSAPTIILCAWGVALLGD
jgi:hypothetical protein